MNRLLEQMGELADMTHGVRDQCLGLVEPGDCGFAQEGAPAVGELIRTMGDVEATYTPSFTTREIDWSVRAERRGWVG